MSNSVTIRHLKPMLSPRFRTLYHSPAQFRAFSSFHPSRQPAARGTENIPFDYETRVRKLRVYKPESQWYPRLTEAVTAHRLSIASFREKYDDLEAGKTRKEDVVSVTGRVNSVRLFGKNLFFLNLQEASKHSLQVVCNLRKLRFPGVNADTFKHEGRLVRRGDSFAATGHPHRTPTGELSLLALSLPTLLSPALHQIPERLEDAETRTQLRYVDMLVNPAAIATLRIRHLVEQHLHSFFNGRGFISVRTPILGVEAGGAVARPFKTVSTELAGLPLQLRIAPELWLKRLVVGGLDKVYEIGPAFRNEGIDATHNPEFHTCEFYEAYSTLEDLMSTTEELLRSLAEHISRAGEVPASNVPGPPDFADPFQRLEFIPTLEKQLSQTLPDLSSPSAVGDLMLIFDKHSVPVPSDPTLPRLLDALGSHFIEPLSHDRPTFITHHPAALSPLSKHFTCPSTNQVVAARAELFLRGREYANMYEEENSPFEQRANFEAQACFSLESQSQHVDNSSTSQSKSPSTAQNANNKAIAPEARHPLDETFLHALEWGLPPTGGWGCGIDRLVMLFAGRDRIADVLSFGTLRNIAKLGVRTGRRKL